MKLNRIFAAGLLAAAAAGPAVASIALPDTGNGELFLVVYDSTDQVSYVKDLGIFIDSFNGLGSYSFTLDDAFFTAFLGIADNTDATFADLRFAVLGGDSVGGTSRRLFSTIDTATTPLTNNQLTNATGFLGLYANNQVTLSANTSHAGPAAINGTSYDVVGNGAYFLAQGGPTLNNVLQGFTNSVAVNTDATFRQFSSNGLPGGNPTNQLTFGVSPETVGGFWRVSSNAGAPWTATYTVVPVPEAEGIAMLLAGFGALGVVVRRRRTA